MTGQVNEWLQKYFAIELQKLALKRDHEHDHEHEQEDQR